MAASTNERAILSQLAARLNISSFNPAEFESMTKNRPHNDDDSELSSSIGEISDFSHTSSSEEHRKADDREQLYKTLAEKESALATLLKEKATLQSVWADRVKRLEESKMSTEQQMRKQQLTYEAEVKARQSQTASELSALRNTVQQLQQTAPLQRDRLNLAKDDLRDLTVTDDMYTSMKQVPEPQQSLREFVLIRVFELMRTQTKAMEPLRAENISMRQRLVESEQQCATLQRDLGRLQKTNAEERADNERELKVQEARNKRLADECGSLQARVQESAAAMSRYDTVRARLDVLESTNAAQESQLLMLNTTVQRNSEERETLQRRLSECEGLLEHIRTDKAYLSKENEHAQAKLHETSRTLERLQAECGDLRRAKDELTLRLLSSHQQQNREHEQKLSEELGVLADRSKSELQEIRIMQREAYEREIKGLRDAREVALRDSDAAKQELKSLRSQFDLLSSEHRQLECKYEAQMSELRSLLKIKAFELDRATVRAEESAKECRTLKLECEQARARFDVLRSEHATLQMEYSQRRAALETELEHVKDRLRSFDQLEYELDFHLMEQQDGNSGVVENRNAADVVSALSSLPTRGSHRVKQSLQLAQKLMEKHRTCESLQKMVAEKEAETEQARADLEKLKSQLRLVEQPHAFLLDAVRARDEQLSVANKDKLRLQRDGDEAFARIQQLQSQNQTLQSKLNELIQSKENVLLLRDALMAKAMHSESVPVQSSQPLPKSSTTKPTQLKTATVNESAKPLWFQQLNVKTRHQQTPLAI